MIDETKLLQQVNRATRAKQLIEDELFREAFKVLEQQYIGALVASAPHEQKMRENLYQALQILGDIGNHFNKIMSDGKIAKAELDQLANKKRPRAA